MTARATLRWANADLRAHRGRAVASVVATAGIIASLLLAAALFSYATNPWERIFTQTRGAHVWLHTGPDADVTALARLDGVAEVSGPFPTVRTTAASGGVRATVELRAATHEPPGVGAPLLVSGRWLDPERPGGIVLERSFAEALWAEPGDTLTLPDGPDGPDGPDSQGGGGGASRELEVIGVAETAEPHYRPGEQPGVGWVLPSTLAGADGTNGPGDEPERRAGQALGLRLHDPQDSDFIVQRAVTALGADQVTGVTKWQEARADAEEGYRLLGLVFGVFGLGALLAGALVASGAISTRIRSQLRDVSVLKAIGFTPGQVIRIFLIQHLALALLAVALGTGTILAFGSRLPGRVGEAAAVWQELPNHLALLLGLPATAILLIAVATGLAAWRAGRVPPVPSVREAGPATAAGPLSRITRGALGLSPGAGPSGTFVSAAFVSAAFTSMASAAFALVLGWRGAFPRRPQTVTAVLRLAVPLLLITAALSVWSTMERFQEHPEQVGLPAALSVRSAHAGDLTEQETQRLLAEHPDVAAVHPGAEADALVPGQTGTITLRGLGTKERPYPFTVVEGRDPMGPDEAVAGEGLLDLLRVEVGDWVRMTVGGRPQILHIVGRSLEPADGGRVISTSLDTLRERTPKLRPDFSLLELRPGSDPRAVSAELGEQVDGGLEIWEVTNPADGLTAARWGIVGLVVVLALIGFTELLTTVGASARDRGRDLLALRAIGMTPRQISGVIVSSTGYIALAAALVGIGGGVLMSRWLIDTQGRLSGIGAGIAQLPSAWTLTGLGAAAVLGAVASALVPAARVSRRRIADSLSASL